MARDRIKMLQGVLPFDKSKVASDVVAGISLAALAIPELMGYTKISGTPVITGLYTILVPMVLYALFGSSRHLVVGADSATAAIVAGTLVQMAAPKSPEWTALAGVMALMAALFLFLSRVARLGFLADFLSRTVLIGFLSGVGVQVAVGELPGMLGLPEPGHGAMPPTFFDLHFLDHIGYPDASISLAVLVLIVVARRISPKLPGALMAVIAVIVASRLLDLGGLGAHLIGPVPGGLPPLALPQGVWDWQTIQRLVPASFAMLVVILSQSAATARAYAARYDEPFDQNVDLVGLGMANIGAGLTGTFVVNGSPTKTQMVESAGGRSQLAHLAASGVVLLVLVFFTAPLAYLPTAALSTIVFLIGIELIDLKGMCRVLVERPWEFWVALLTAAAVLFLGVEKAILLAVFMSLAVHTRHGYLVNNMLLVPDGDGGWRQQRVDGGEHLVPGLMIYRFMHNIYFANCNVLAKEVRQLVDSSQTPLSWFCIDAAAVNDVDFSSAETLKSLHAFLAARGIRLVFCETVDEVKAQLERSGVAALLGEGAFHTTPNAVVGAFGRYAGRSER